jgi:hypothetical protein
MCVCHVRKVSGHHIAYLCVPSWEFITTLDYEWSVIQGRRPYRWTIWVSIVLLGLMRPTAEPQTDVIPLQVHSLTRVATLLAVIVNMIGFDSASPINCQVSPVSHILSKISL